MCYDVFDLMFHRLIVPALGVILAAFVVSLAVVLNFGAPTKVVASSCVGCILSPAETFEKATHVFLGRVLSQGYRRGPWIQYECDGRVLKQIEIAGDSPLELNRFHVDTVWKGAVSESMLVAGHARCGYSFSVGESYIVYASKIGRLGIPHANFCDVVHVPKTGPSRTFPFADGRPRPTPWEYLELLGQGWTPVPGSAIVTPTPESEPTCPIPTTVPTATQKPTVAPTPTTVPTPTLTPTPTLEPTVAATVTFTPSVAPTPTLSPTTVPTPTLTTTIVPTYAPTIAAPPTALPSPAVNGTCSTSGARIDLGVLALVGLLGTVGLRRLLVVN